MLYKRNVFLNFPFGCWMLYIGQGYAIQRMHTYCDGYIYGRYARGMLQLPTKDIAEELLGLNMRTIALIGCGW